MISTCGFSAGRKPMNDASYWFEVAALAVWLLGGAGLPGDRISGDGRRGTGAAEVDDPLEHGHQLVVDRGRKHPSLPTVAAAADPGSAGRCAARPSRPPFAIAWYIDAICIAVTPMPWPMGMVPIDDSVQSRPGSTIPRDSPGKRSAVSYPNPYRRIHRVRSCLPTIWAISSVPMLDEILRIRRTEMSHGLWLRVVVDHLVAEIQEVGDVVQHLARPDDARR